MPDVHVPQLGDHSSGKSYLKIALEVLLIAVGVFLGLMGEQWRERRQHREMAEASLRRFRTEIAANRRQVASVVSYHTTMQAKLGNYLDATPADRTSIPVNLQGVRPAFIDHTAWDLALATQSLAYIDEQTAYALSRLYFTQQEYLELTHGILQAMYVRPPMENEAVFLGAVSIYYADIVRIEPQLLEMYDALEKQIDRALGESSSP